MSSSPGTRILFITRRYPPSVGGIQVHCHNLYTRLSARRPVRLVALGRQWKIHLLWFLPWAFVRAFFDLLLRRVDAVYFGDGVVGALAPLLRPIARARFVVTIYGLEMAYGNRLARGLMRRGAQVCDHVVLISRHSREISVRAGISAEKITIVYLGVEALVLGDEQCALIRERFERTHGLRFGRDRVLLNFGRLVPRKGVAAFLEKGMPLLDPDIRLVIGGAGPDLGRIRALSEKPELQDRVVLLESPSDETIAMLRQSADLFIFPNVPTPNDAEGFGMTQLESMYTGTPVVAFAVDALVESVREGGYLIEPNDYPSFVGEIHRYYALPEREREAKRAEARGYVRREYSWEKTAAQYLDLLEGRK